MPDAASPDLLSVASETLPLLTDLVARRSLTPDDAGCCARLMAELAPLGFVPEYLDAAGVTNLWAVRPADLGGAAAPLFVLAGHTDVVPPGPEAAWTSPPFAPTVRDGTLYGRGAADMKSGLACLVTAVRRLMAAGPVAGRLAFLVTSDEEGPARHGTRHVVEALKARGVVPAYAIVAESSSAQRLADRVVIGRRGSLGCDLTVHGRQGHVAYPEKADNPIHRLAPALAELVATRWDEGTAEFPPTSFQVSNLRAGTGANNVIPGDLELVFNFRYSTASTADALKTRVLALLDRHGLRYDARWWHSGEPFLTRPGRLRQATVEVVREATGTAPELFTGGGTSDARFIAPWGAETIELGPLNASIHKVDEHVRVADLDQLAELYARIVGRVLAGPEAETGTGTDLDASAGP